MRRTSTRWGILLGLLGMLLIMATERVQALPLHATTAEIALWNQRRTSGPYLADWNRLLPRANTFRTTPSSDTWAGNQLNVHWDGDLVMQAGQPPNAHPGRQKGDGLRDAGLVYLVTGDTTYRDAVRSALLTQTGIAGTNFANTVKWNPNAVILWDDNFEIANWLRKLVYGYSYIRASLPVAERTTIEAWFVQAATYWDGVIHNWAKLRFPNRLSDVYGTPVAPYNPGTTYGVTHFGGPTAYAFHEGWVNIPATHNAMVAVVGILTDHATLKANAKRFVREWLTYNVAPDGTILDQYRWHTTSTDPPLLGYLYAGTVLGSIVATADHFARAGDTELYTYTTSGGLFGWEGGTKSLLLAMRRYAQITLGERGLPNGILVYASTDATLDVTERIGPGTAHVTDIGMIPANVYFQDPLVLASYTRTMPASPASSGYDMWGGDWGTYSGIRFMFGLMEGVHNPYVSALPDLTTGLVLHLSLNDGSGSTAVDAAGGDHPGTLSGTPTWVAGQIGSGTLSLDGVDDSVQVTGELSASSSVTVAAWVKVGGYPTSEGHVVSLGDHVVLRVAASTLGAFFTSTPTTYHTMTFPAVLGTTAWHHLAYTVTPGTQRLYLDGLAVATATATQTLSYAGLGTNTFLGRHGNGQTGFRLQGVLDEVRVYSRALRATDVAGLYAYRATPPTLSITQPTSNPTYSAAVAPLAGVAGVASDEVAVRDVSFTCPQCSPTSGLASGLTSWVLPTVTLATGANVITVTATDDAGQTTTDSLTVTLGTVDAPTGLRIVPAFTMGGAGR